MKRIRMKQWLGITLLGAALGCNSTSGNRYAEGPSKPRGVALVYADGATACQSCRTYKGPAQAQQPIQPTPAYVVPAGHVEMVQEGQVVTADHVMVEGEPPMVVSAAGQQPAGQMAQVVQVAAPASSPYQVSAPTQTASTSTPTTSAGSQWAPVVEHVVPARGGNLQGESYPVRRAVTDITASPCFGKAEDYSWLQGQVEYSRMSKSWRLRYASVDETDRFGGSVTLTGDTLLDSLKDGEYVRIRGYLPNPDARGIAPTYRVEAIEAVAK